MHTTNFTNFPSSWGRAEGIIIAGLSYFPDPLPSSFQTWAPGTFSSLGERNLPRLDLIAVGAVGGIPALLCLG
ncbi:hypothetical protein M407DRAFT_193447 [Tulasnella calospora MUT 4182]|uniref:Uncharacterized protein n=1 Tax=Tulasnella calospora MUT 4182 TaxID=1051891 RepID=A0A0C3QAF3_9AGAM|nr:hypothetical protein M407DRAFT_193447 [Tulasnella calospora MUT 4182]